MSIFRLSCFFLTLLLTVCTLAVGLILSPYWKENREAPKEAKIHLSLSIISILLLGASSILTLVSIISGPGRTKQIIIIVIILLVITVGFLCASIVYMFTQVNHSFAYWIFASLWISITCIPFGLCTIYIQPIQMERL
ncbi:CAI-2 protein [Schistosoma japonicum]|uniref:CAI-2 protein n=1 Tax=Schistosoma japonicum TaxID=6182 RepID=A0A4Z2DE39_SCHJA|nr:CAI-2 protein [Schistosoma japonicum]